MGAEKPTATPAATPQATKSRFSMSLRNQENLEKAVETPKDVDLPCDDINSHQNQFTSNQKHITSNQTKSNFTLSVHPSSSHL